MFGFLSNQPIYASSLHGFMLQSLRHLFKLEDKYASLER